MKKLFKLIIICIILSVLSFTACNDADDGKLGNNQFRIKYVTGDDVIYNVLKTDAGFQYHYGNYFGNGIPNVDFAIRMSDGKDTYEIYLETFVPAGQKRIVEGEYEFASGSSEYAAKRFTFDSDINIKRPEEGEDEDGEEILYKLSGGLITVSVAGEGDSAVYTINIVANISQWDEEKEELGKFAGYVEGTYVGPLVWSDEEIPAEIGEEE